MAMTDATPKEQMMQVLRNLPDDSSFDELLRELVFLRMIERGIADSDAERVLSNEEMQERIRSWSN